MSTWTYMEVIPWHTYIVVSEVRHQLLLCPWSQFLQPLTHFIYRPLGQWLLGQRVNLWTDDVRHEPNNLQEHIGIINGQSDVFISHCNDSQCTVIGVFRQLGMLSHSILIDRREYAFCFVRIGSYFYVPDLQIFLRKRNSINVCVHRSRQP